MLYKSKASDDHPNQGNVIKVYLKTDLFYTTLLLIKVLTTFMITYQWLVPYSYGCFGPVSIVPLLYQGILSIELFWTLISGEWINQSNYHIVASRRTSWLVTPHVTNWIQTQLVIWAPKNKSCSNELKFCEDSRNFEIIRCWKFQLSIMENKKVLFLKQYGAC